MIEPPAIITIAPSTGCLPTITTRPPCPAMPPLCPLLPVATPGPPKITSLPTTTRTIHCSPCSANTIMKLPTPLTPSLDASHVELQASGVQDENAEEVETWHSFFEACDLAEMSAASRTYDGIVLYLYMVATGTTPPGNTLSLTPTWHTSSKIITKSTMNMKNRRPRSRTPVITRSPTRSTPSLPTSPSTITRTSATRTAWEAFTAKLFAALQGIQDPLTRYQKLEVVRTMLQIKQEHLEKAYDVSPKVIFDLTEQLVEQFGNLNPTT